MSRRHHFVGRISGIIEIRLTGGVNPRSIGRLSRRAGFVTGIRNSVMAPGGVLAVRHRRDFTVCRGHILVALVHGTLRFISSGCSGVGSIPGSDCGSVSVIHRVGFGRGGMSFGLGCVGRSRRALTSSLSILSIARLSSFSQVEGVEAALGRFLGARLVGRVTGRPRIRPPLARAGLLGGGPGFGGTVRL